MARPLLPKEDRRSRYIGFRANSEEYNKLEQLAESTGKPVGELIREKLFKGRFPAPKLAKLDAIVYGELKRIGNNVNQIARKVNAGKYPADLGKTLATLLSYLETIIALLLKHDRQSEDR